MLTKDKQKRKDAFEVLIAATCAALFIASILLMAGCVSPTMSYQHLSDPRVANDGYDLVCGGAQHATHGLEFNAGVCKDFSGTQGEYVTFGVRKVWNVSD